MDIDGDEYDEQNYHDVDTLGLLVCMMLGILIVMSMMSKISIMMIPSDCWSVWCCGC